MAEKNIKNQTQLAAETGIDNGTISRWKRGLISPTDSSLQTLSARLDCDFNYLKYGVRADEIEDFEAYKARTLDLPADNPPLHTMELTPSERDLILALRRRASEQLLQKNRLLLWLMAK